MMRKILVTPRSFHRFKHKAYPLMESQGYEILENTTGRTLSEGELLEYAKQNVVGIIVGIDPLPESTLRQFTRLKAISKYGVGLDNIDLVTAAELGIKVKNAVGTNNISVAELTIGFLFCLARHIPSTAVDVKNGKWTRIVGTEITGKTMGLVGLGRIGNEVALRARGLMMSVCAYDPFVEDDEFFEKHQIRRCHSLEELLRSSDVVSLHLPCNQETRHLINSKTLAMMKPTAFLLNTSRGELINEDDLYEALINKVIAGAGSDVFSSEPPSSGEKLLKLDNFLLTSHIGALTDEAVERMVMVSTNNLLESLAEENLG